MQNIEDALNIVILNCDINQDTQSELTDERRLWLENSVGLPKLVTNPSNIYRPYYVIALHYWLTPDNNLLSGEQAKFDQNFEVTRRYLMRQKMLDIQQNLDIPLEYQCDTLIGNMKADCLKCDNQLFSKQKTRLSITGF
jgi:hypothetical protein